LNKFDIKQRGIENEHPTSLSIDVIRAKRFRLAFLPDLEHEENEFREYVSISIVGLVNYMN
jgi:hypothetical protein